MKLEIPTEIEEAYELRKDSELRSLILAANPDLLIKNATARIISIIDQRDKRTVRIEYDLFQGDRSLGNLVQDLQLDRKGRIRAVSYE